MATQRMCDYCKQVKPDVNEVQVDVRALGVVRPDQATGASSVADACAACRPKAYLDLAKKTAAQLEHDIPEHLRMWKEIDEQVALKQQIREAGAETPKAYALQAQYDIREKQIAERRAAVHAGIESA